MKTTWIISDEPKIGSQNQCIGVAHSLGLSPHLHKINARSIWRFLPPRLWFSPLKGLKEILTPPWPDYIIAGGRASAAPTAAIGRFGTTKTIFLQNPGMNLKKFDVVIAPHHDELEGNNVISVLGIPHAITHENLKAAQELWDPKFQSLPKPWTGVILGGDCKHHTITKDDMERLAYSLNQWHKDIGGSLLITPSRRTRPDTISDLLSNLQMPYYCWDICNDNPYLAILGSCDRFCVTSDSVSMIGEACYTGKPVYVFDLKIKSRKFNSLLDSLIAGNHIRLVEPTLKDWDVVQLDELTRIKPQIISLLGEAPPEIDTPHQSPQT